MTIAISILVPAGIVLAADSRQVTELVSGQIRVDSDNVDKVIRLGPALAVIVQGQGSFYSSRSASPQSIGEVLQAGFTQLPRNGTIKDTAIFLHQKVTTAFKKHLDVTNLERGSVSFYVSGYSSGRGVGELYRCDAPGKVTLERTTRDAGAVWIGETHFINRLIRGYDSRLFENLPQTKRLTELKETLLQVCRGFELYINFQTMPLQDAIDLAIFLVHLTIESQRFSDGIVGAPGQFPTCGGVIDVARITPVEGFRWLQHKEPRVDPG